MKLHPCLTESKCGSEIIDDKDGNINAKTVDCVDRLDYFSIWLLNQLKHRFKDLIKNYETEKEYKSDEKIINEFIEKFHDTDSETCQKVLNKYKYFNLKDWDKPDKDIFS